jgi:acetyl-CoA carboxylase carboxyltransferase component
MEKLGPSATANFNRIDAKPPKSNNGEIYGILSEGNTKPYNMVDLIECIVDENSFDEFKQDYGKTIVCGYARVEGWAVGIVANQRTIVKSKKGEMQLGGVIYNDSADKAARFILNCNQKKIPLVFLQDVTGFMVGSRSEHSGIIKDGAKLVNAVANSVVPKITVIVGNSYGAGNYAMCGKAYDPRFIYAWPSAKIAVMGGEQAAKTMLQIQVAAMKAKGEVVTPEQETALLNRITDNYTRQTKPEYAASRLWVDAIIDPKERLDAVVQEMARISSLNKSEKYILWKQLYDIAKFNQGLFFSKDWQQSISQEFLTNLYRAIGILDQYKNKIIQNKMDQIWDDVLESKSL